jgi:hypothetical protein
LRYDLEVEKPKIGNTTKPQTGQNFFKSLFSGNHQAVASEKKARNSQLHFLGLSAAGSREVGAYQ